MASKILRSLLNPVDRGARRLATVRGATQPAVLRPMASEIQNHSLEPRSLEVAVRHIHEDGLVVIEDVVPSEHLDLLNERMVQDARTLQARGKDGPFNYNEKNIQQDAPPVAQYFSPSVFISTSSQTRCVKVGTLMLPIRSDRDAGNNRCARSSSEVDILLCQLRDACPPWCKRPKATRSLRRRLYASQPPICPRG